MVFGFIVTSEVKPLRPCWRNDIITAMVTRRTSQGGGTRRTAQTSRANRGAGSSARPSRGAFARSGAAGLGKVSAGRGAAGTGRSAQARANRQASGARSAHAGRVGGTARSSRPQRVGNVRTQREGGTYVGSATPTPLSGTPGLGGIGLAGGAPTSHGTPRPSTGDGGQTLISRRGLLLGALGVGVLAAAGAGAAAVVSSQGEKTPTIQTLKVPTNAVSSIADLTQVENADDCMTKLGEYDLPYGTLVFANDSTFACCLLPTEKAKPLAQVATLSLASGNYTVVLPEAQGQDDGFEVYDARCTSQGVVWTEANIMNGVWRVFSAKLSADGGSLSSVQQLDEGSTDEFETPTIAAVGSHAFWQVMPKVDNTVTAASQIAQLKRASMGSADGEVAYESAGRMATAPYATSSGVVITPRATGASSYYQLTLVSENGDVSDTCTLPASMKPLEAGYGKTGFTFAFDATYSYGDGIANLGTYAPASKPGNGDYSDQKWVRFDRTPTTAPAWCGNWLMVKSTSAVCGVDVDGKRYFALSTENGADDYGEWLASEGEGDTVVTYSNINYTPIGSDAVTCCRVKVWQAK